MSKECSDKKFRKHLIIQDDFDKRCLSAEDYSLLSSALRPRLLKVLFIFLISLSFSLAAETFWLTDEVSAASLEITIPANYAIDLNPGTGSTFGESSNQQISIKTSGSFGYTLNIKPSDGTDLKNGENTIKAITKTEGYDSSDGYKNSDEINTWVYKPGKLNSVDNTKYLPFPSIETLLDKTDTNNDVANNYDLTIAAKVDNTLPSGKYSNNFIISATANTVSYSITYNLNEGEWNGESPQTGTVTENKIKLDSNTPTKENYEFLGWCSKPTSDKNCDGETKQPEDEITLTNSDNQFTFYAICKHAVMQNWTGCSSLSQGVPIELIDARDDNIYKVAKLKDNRCWMIENLRIQNKTLTSSNSNVTSDFVLPASSEPNTWSITDYVNKKVHIDDTYGGYYNWFTATAGEGKQNKSSGNVSQSICPKGWRLPTGGSNSEISTMVSSYGSSASQLQTQPVPNFLLGGLISSGQIVNRGIYGVWWSSTADSVNTASVLCIYSQCTNLLSSGNKAAGNYVRCIVP